jgi:hypothetical protein
MKIRYIEKCSKITGEITNYYIEQKTWYGWKRLGYTINMGYGSVYYYFNNKDKKTLLLEVLEHKKLCLNFIDIIEYPSIKEY